MEDFVRHLRLLAHHLTERVEQARINGEDNAYFKGMLKGIEFSLEAFQTVKKHDKNLRSIELIDTREAMEEENQDAPKKRQF